MYACTTKGMRDCSFVSLSIFTKQKPFLHNSLYIPPSKMARRYYIKPEQHNDKKSVDPQEN